ncbi:MAG: GDSL-type esterase/lipase family protein [Nocardioides sp.]|nr:GDSL-type esterase/lipase family protein [Nocardioides sp.]
MASPVRLAVLGDSIAWGQGATSPGDRLAARLAAGLAGHEIEVETRVLAVPGARSADLGPQVRHAVTWPPQVVVMVIGANDLTHLVPLDVAVHALADAVRRLRAVGAQVVVAPAPDLSAVPHVPVMLRPVVQAASAQLRARQAEVVLRHGGRVADRDQVASRAFASDASLFSADRFHPSSSGYAVIASSLLPEVRAAVAALGS